MRKVISFLMIASMIASVALLSHPRPARADDCFSSLYAYPNLYPSRLVLGTQTNSDIQHVDYVEISLNEPIFIDSVWVQVRVSSYEQFDHTYPINQSTDFLRLDFSSHVLYGGNIDNTRIYIYYTGSSFSGGSFVLCESPSPANTATPTPTATLTQTEIRFEPPKPDVIITPYPLEEVEIAPMLPTVAPSPTHTPAPPAPLPTLIPGLDTLVYATTGKYQRTGVPHSELYRAQVDQAGQLVGEVYRIDGVDHLPPSDGWHHTMIYNMYPSPDGRYIMFTTGWDWLYLVNVQTGQLSQFERAIFLNWTPDGAQVLVLKLNGPDATAGAWLINVEGSKETLIPIKGELVFDDVRGVSYSPDGQEFVYSIANRPDQIWRSSFDGSTQTLLYETSDSLI